MWRNWFIRFFLFISFPVSVYAQQFSYKNFDTDNGFPSSESYFILQDKLGYMWFATDHGVARYNGDVFTIYTTADGLVDNTIIRIAEDSKGRIWMMGHNNEICYWEKGRIITPSFSAEIARLFEGGESIKTFYIDKNDDLWISFFYDMYRIHVSGKFFIEKQKRLSDCHFAFKIVDNKKALYFYSRRFVPYINVNNNFTIKIGCETNDHVFYKTIQIKLNTQGWNGYFYAPHNKTLYFYHANTLLIIPETGKVEARTFPKPILSVSVESDGGLWLGFRRGGIHYYKNSDATTPSVSFLDNCSVNYWYRDREGGIWLSTLDNGIFYIPSTATLVYPNIAYLNDKIPFIGGTNNAVFVRTFKTELTSGVYSITTSGITDQKQLTEFQNKYGHFTSICQLGDTVYVTYTSGFALFTPDFKLLEINRGYMNGIKYFIGSDAENFYYLRKTGIFQVKKTTGCISKFNATFRVTCAVLDNNKLLVGGKKGLYLHKDGKYTSLSYLNPLLGKSIADMKVDHNGGLWLATISDGVIYLKNKQFQHITKKNGLVSNICTSLAIDSQHRVWVGTTSGISQLNYQVEKKDWKIKNFTKEHGFNSNEIIQLFTNNDSLWVGTMKGVSHAIISDITSPKPLCPVYIDSIKVNSKNTTPDKNGFSYNENNFEFKTSALTFVNQGNHLFRYRLMGLDSTWKETKMNELSFNRLPSGDFQLQIQAANPDNEWSHSAVYSFTIHKPIWFTWWFISGEVILILFLIFLIISFIVKRITRREKEKVHINKLLTEYQMKALTSQMNPHFIFNAINSIQNFIMRNDADIAYDYLEKFSRLIRTVLTNSEKKEVILRDELDTMALYIELEQLRFEHSFDYVCEIDQQLNTEDIVIPALIIQPYIENAIWHGLMPLRNRRGRITLLITKQLDKLKIVLTDNGIGRSASDLIPKKIKSKDQQSMGTNLTSSRIKLFGNECNSSIQIIDNYNEQHEATGTIIEILLPFIEKY